MAESFSIPNFSSSRSLSSIFSDPENAITLPPLLPTMSLSQSDVTSSSDDDDSEIREIDLEPLFEPICCDYLDENYDHFSFVTDLFDPRAQLGSDDVDDESEVDLELGLGLGLGLGPAEEEGPHFEGLRVVSVDSESDSDIEADTDDNNGGAFFFGGCNGFDDSEDDFEPPILHHHDHHDDEEQEVMIHSDSEEEEEAIDFGVEEAIRDLEWEILFAVNNFNREVYDMGFNVDMYDAIITDMEDRAVQDFDFEFKGSPPAAESVIENLPRVCLSKEILEQNGVVCAVCKEEVSEEDIVRRLPCLHYYHGECIVPWLKMRNTCPVCRRELPTDDPEYEYMKHGDDDHGHGDMSLNSQFMAQISMPPTMLYDEGLVMDGFGAKSVRICFGLFLGSRQDHAFKCQFRYGFNIHISG